MKNEWISALSLCVALLPGTAIAAGGASHGKQLYQQCAGCHDRTAGGSLGPDLAGVVGRKAGSRDDYRYSNAMMRSSLIWDEPTLRAYVHAPQETIKGTKMPYAGMADLHDVDDLIAYLKTLK